jgi:hypothetical protein
MAITAAITLSSATAYPNQRVGVTCTVSNSGGSSVNVTGIRPTICPTGVKVESVAAVGGLAPIGPGMTVAVAASGTLAISWQSVAFAPQPGNGPNPANPNSFVYDVGAIVTTSDGAVTVATTTTLTVSVPTH